MSVLTKDIRVTVIPGSPSNPGTPGSPYIPAYCFTETVYPAPVYTFIPIEDNPSTPEDESGGYWTWITSPYGEEVTTCYPAVPAVAGIPADPGTPDQISYFYNDGWNSHSTSIASLDCDETFSCTFSQGIVSAYIVLGQEGMEERTVGSFSHGILVDVNGVYIYEYGTLVYTLFSGNIGTRELKVSRRTDNSIEYSIGDRAYTSTLNFPIVDGIPAYVYAFLYSGGDALFDAAIETDTGAIEYGTATLTATSSLTAHDTYATATLTATSSLTARSTYAGTELTGTSSITARVSPLVYLVATSSIFAKSTIGLESNASLSSLTGGAWESPGMDQQTAYLGSLTGEATEGSIVPATPLRAQGNLPSIVGSATLYNPTANNFEGDITVPVPKINASFGLFGAIEVPKPIVEGTFVAATTLKGDLNVPAPIVDGTIQTTSLFEGDLDVPKPLVSGALILGTVLTGNLNVPKLRVIGTFTTDDDFAGDLDVPLPIVSGVIASTADDSAWEYSGSVSCQQ